MTTANIIIFGLGVLCGFALAIDVMWPEYKRHEQAIKQAVGQK